MADVVAGVLFDELKIEDVKNRRLRGTFLL